MYVYWAHVVVTGEIVHGHSIERVLEQLDESFYGPIYCRWNWPLTWDIRALNYNSTWVFEVL